ncbi:MAG: hypothetical protein R3B95_04885 [Nitrospirales bacterium]|nr:hypothetical protein [Nitrospirales bacterium]
MVLDLSFAATNNHLSSVLFSFPATNNGSTSLSKLGILEKGYQQECWVWEQICCQGWVADFNQKEGCGGKVVVKENGGLARKPNFEQCLIEALLSMGEVSPYSSAWNTLQRLD